MRTSNVVTKGDPRIPQTPDALYARAQKGADDLGAFYKKTKAREDTEKRKLEEFNKMNRDAARGIQNPRSQVSGGYSESVSPEILEKTVGEEYISRKSIESRTNKKTRQLQQLRGDDSQFSQEGNIDSPTPAEALRAQTLQRASQRLQAGLKGARLAKKLSVSTRWWLLGIMSTLFMWQFVFALASMVGFGLDALVKESFIGKLVGLFVDIEKFFPAIYLGYGGWGISALIALSTFLMASLWYHFNNVHIFGSIITLSITLLCLSLSFLPISNLFPFLLLWVLYMNTKSLFSST